MYYTRKYSYLAAILTLTVGMGWAAMVHDVRAPEPVSLTGDLLNATGASAAAVWVAPDRATTAYRLPPTFVAAAFCAGVTKGIPCNDAALAAGLPLYGRVLMRPDGGCRCAK